MVNHTLYLGYVNRQKSHWKVKKDKKRDFFERGLALKEYRREMMVLNYIEG